MPRDKWQGYKRVLRMLLDPRRDTDADAALSERVDALLEEYRIKRSSPRAWQRLALALAFRHVRGFRFPSTRVADLRRAGRKKVGRKLALPAAELSRLIREIDKLVVAPQTRTVKEACNELARREGRSPHSSARKAQEYENLYYRHRRRVRQDPVIDWSHCQMNPLTPCINQDMELEACLRGCRYPDTCPLFAGLACSLQKVRTANSAMREQLARLLIWRAIQDWASPSFALEQGRKPKPGTGKRNLRNG
jgi:hypothetical protein